MLTLPVCAIESIPIDIPTDYVVGLAGLGSIVVFAVGAVMRVLQISMRRQPIDPLIAAGWLAGASGTLAMLTWLVSLLLEVPSES